MPIECIIPVLNVSDIEESLDWFEKLGWARTFTWNGEGLIGEGPLSPTENEHGPADFAGVCSGEVKIFLCVDGQGQRGLAIANPDGGSKEDGMWMTWWVSTKLEVDQLHKLAESHGMTISHPPTDEPWGVREFHLRHPNGHMFRVSCGIEQ